MQCTLKIGAIPAISYPFYNGDYKVKPSLYNKFLFTENRIMLDDLIVQSIPYQEVSNLVGGTTVTIGGY